jgi:hypothetical protein
MKDVLIRVMGIAFTLKDYKERTSEVLFLHRRRKVTDGRNGAAV